ncbi:MAG: S1 RNA-binding domain-containing protein [Candidatus Uhrbacteria bacterium]|nr:S1 RNA-binding domain-containing protein [Patescibacteria group bacterium]MBU1906886.1 S1 RNA-binding domain-containing protein [Patescibacteria group bacterium]
MEKIDTTASQPSRFEKLLIEGEYLKKIPKVGDVVKGKIISASRREVRLDIEGVTTGVVRGRELFAESSEYADLDTGEEIEATVIDLENENGEMELSFRFAGQQRAWDELRKLFVSAEIVPARVLEANKGGLIIKLRHITGFLPVSQLSPDNYPRVSGGDKQKILEKLKKFVGTDIDVRVLDVNEAEDKLIVSEKIVWEEKQKGVISQYKVGGLVEGEITAVADFGAFVKFDSLEGLVHISEIAWQRIDHPSDILKVGDKVKAAIIGIEGSKIFLSMKKLIDDPWKNVGEKYKIGEVVEGKVLKVNPFGFFVELDPEIHGLAHVSEMGEQIGADLSAIAKIGEVRKFKIVSIEPTEHRLGLALDGKVVKTAAKTEDPAEESTPEEPADEPAPAEPTEDTETPTEE